MKTEEKTNVDKLTKEVTYLSNSAKQLTDIIIDLIAKGYSASRSIIDLRNAIESLNKDIDKELKAASGDIDGL